MKRSEMVEIITRMLEGNNFEDDWTDRSEVEDYADWMLTGLLKQGMLPPHNGHYNEWKPEDEKE